MAFAMSSARAASARAARMVRALSSMSSAPSPTPSSAPVVASPPILVNPGIHPRLLARAEAPRASSRSLVLGAVAYCEAISSIWKGMMRHFARRGLDVDFVLFTSYERQVDALLKGQINIAWNGPLAHARLLRLAAAKGQAVLPLGMRDVDKDFRTHVVVRADSGIKSLSDLQGRLVAAGTVDSPQGYLMPMRYLRRQGVDLSTLSVFRYDRDVGKHGDTAYGEDSVLEALASGTAQAGFLSDLMWSRYVRDKRVPEGPDGRPLLELLSLPEPIAFDHCQFDALEGLGLRALEFQRALLAMDGSGHPEDKKTMELEGIQRAWVLPRGGALAEEMFAAPAAKKRAGGGGASGDKDASAPPAASGPRPAFPDASLGYERTVDALEIFGEPKLRYPGVLHTPRKHPFKYLMVDTRVVLDSFGC
jgi:phosphonate transport system substrate-binding protein